MCTSVKVKTPLCRKSPNVLGNLAAGGLSGAYYPRNQRHSIQVTICDTLLNTATGAFGTLFKEFTLRHVTRGGFSHNSLNPPPRYAVVWMTRRRWIADTWTDTTACLKGDQAFHLARVLRAEPGQIFDVLAGGFLRRAEVTGVSEQEVVFTLGEELEADAALPVHLLLAIIKFDHYEWGLEKATELGAARITPVLARRTEKHLAHAAGKRVERWRRIVREAAQQSRRSDLPEVDDPQPLKPALAFVAAPHKVLLAETEQKNTLAAALQRLRSHEGPGAETNRKLALAIGPEGGWAPDEIEIFHSLNWQSVTLGPRILRAETAALAGLAICSALL